MGTLTPQKAKSNFYKMKNDLVLLKTNYEKSGNGDGTVIENEGEMEIWIKQRSSSSMLM